MTEEAAGVAAAFEKNEHPTGKLGAPRPPDLHPKDARTNLYWDSPPPHGRCRVQGHRAQMAEPATMLNIGQQQQVGLGSAPEDVPACLAPAFCPRRGSKQKMLQSRGIVPEAQTKDGRWHANAHPVPREGRNIQVALLEDRPAIRIFPNREHGHGLPPFDTRSEASTPRVAPQALDRTAGRLSRPVPRDSIRDEPLALAFLPRRRDSKQKKLSSRGVVPEPRPHDLIARPY